MANLDDEYLSTDRLNEYKGLQIVHLNTRSLFPKLDEIRYKFLTESMDVLCFTETWLHNQISDNILNIKGFSLRRNDRPLKKGGGTCIYVNHRIQFMECLPNISVPEIEIQSLMLMGNGNRSQSFKPIISILVYRPPQGNHQRALELIKDYVNSIPNISNKELIILGDLNWDYLDTSNIGWKNLHELELEFSVNQIITSATRNCLSKDSLIDVILTNMNNIFLSGCLDTSLSDHHPIFVIKKRKKTLRTFERKLTRNYRNYDSDLFQQNLIKLY